MADTPNLPPIANMVQSLLTGQIDHGSLLRMPNLNSRSFWLGAAIGAGAVMLLKSRANAAGGPASVHGVGFDAPPPAER